MVNAAKRWRETLAKLIKVKYGDGSVPLPPFPAPQIKRIYMRLPSGEYKSWEYYRGARKFWHRELRSLKYWNPSLPVEVETVRTGSNEPLYMTITYEAENASRLSQTPQFPKPLLRIKAPRQASRRRQLPEGGQIEPDNAITAGAAEATTPTPSIEESKSEATFEERTYGNVLSTTGDEETRADLISQIQPVSIPPHIAAVAPSDEIVTVAQPAADPSEPQTTSPPVVRYQRTLTLPLAALRGIDIFEWLRQPLLPEMSRKRSKINKADSQKLVGGPKRREQSAEDRARVKRGVDAMKREQAEIRQAKAAAQASGLSV